MDFRPLCSGPTIGRSSDFLGGSRLRGSKGTCKSTPCSLWSSFSGICFWEDIDGISGLIQLGIAWESSDAFRTLAAVLDSQRMSALSELAYLREDELIVAGMGSLHPVARVRELMHPDHTKFLLDRKPVDDYFPTARAAADQRNTAWIAYQEERYAQGMHPDTHPDFWNAWTEPASPEPPGPSLGEQLERYSDKNVGVVIVILILSISLIVLLTFWLAQRPSRMNGKRLKPTA